jgi:GGDEF domain-containing protein
LANPERTLVVRDMETGPHSADLVEPKALPHRAVLGCALRQKDGVKALLFVFFGRTRAFPRAEFALLEAVAGLIGQVIEIEDLKQSLTRLEDALAITRAVMEDSSVRDPETDLPNLRYLEIWQKAMLGSEHRPERLVVAECRVAVRNRKDVARILKAAEGVRAGDLVVRVAPERFLIIFQHTPRSVAHILLLRLRMQLDGAPMGVTLWIPGPEGQGLASCQPRLDAALAESQAMAQPALVWRLPEGVADEPLPPKRSMAPAHSTPQRWEPPVLQIPSGNIPVTASSGKVEPNP